MFAEPERAKEALAAGATYAGGLELVEKARFFLFANNNNNDDDNHVVPRPVI